MKEYTINQVHQATIDELYLWLGQDLLESTKGIFPINSVEIAIFAKVWLNSKWNEIEKAVCENKRAYEFLSKESDEKKLIFEISNIIIGYLTGIPPIVVAAILIKKGLENLCHPIWQVEREKWKNQSRH